MKRCNRVKPVMDLSDKITEWTRDDRLRQPVFLGSGKTRMQMRWFARSDLDLFDGLKERISLGSYDSWKIIVQNLMKDRSSFGIDLFLCVLIESELI